MQTKPASISTSQATQTRRQHKIRTDTSLFTVQALVMEQSKSTKSKSSLKTEESKYLHKTKVLEKQFQIHNRQVHSIFREGGVLFDLLKDASDWLDLMVSERNKEAKNIGESVKTLMDLVSSFQVEMKDIQESKECKPSPLSSLFSPSPKRTRRVDRRPENPKPFSPNRNKPRQSKDTFQRIVRRKGVPPPNSNRATFIRA